MKRFRAITTFTTGGTVVPFTQTVLSIRPEHVVSHAREGILKDFPDAKITQGPAVLHLPPNGSAVRVL